MKCFDVVAFYSSRKTKIKIIRAKIKALNAVKAENRFRSMYRYGVLSGLTIKETQVAPN